jgi:hypothetical protein
MGKPTQGRGEQRGGVGRVTVDEGERSMWGSTGSEWEDAMDGKAKGGMWGCTGAGGRMCGRNA